MSSRLEQLCGDDKELFRVLSNLMFLDPAKINLPLEGILAETQEFEKNGNTVRAEVGYRIAGGISLHKGDSEGVKTYFSKAASLTGNARPEYRTIAKRAREAVDIARKYYENTEPTRM